MSRKRSEHSFLRPIETLRPSRRKVEQVGPGSVSVALSIAAAVGMIVWGSSDKLAKTHTAVLPDKSVFDLGVLRENISEETRDKVVLTALVENTADQIGEMVNLEIATEEIPPLP